MYTKLPKPDQHGNYWFGVPGKTDEPAIIPISYTKVYKSGDLISQKYMLSTPDGVLFDKVSDRKSGDLPKFREFDTPLAAFQELKRLSISYNTEKSVKRG